ncbi:zinc metalloproteinase nas-8-like [Pollicipes pollicipes]|uniref:zinc metalloproteinase nas-8-like n=1 Tax=Pollicipes pollicipes TaxID=41117 RepID=UPI0018853E93|nr:zinc metalloproteinase nas-8-like [Pollicipes pollicipes]
MHAPVGVLVAWCVLAVTVALSSVSGQAMDYDSAIENILETFETLGRGANDVTSGVISDEPASGADYQASDAAGRLRVSRSWPPRTAPPDALQLWPDAVIPYVISFNYSSAELAVITRVFRLFEQTTCLRLVPRTHQRDYVHVNPSGRCSGKVGRVGGRQRISMPHWCLNFGNVAHELMHAAGFWHEQQRPDRDRFVTVLWENIKPRYREADYARKAWSDMGEGSWRGPYDYHSILHYSDRGSAIDAAHPSMVAKRAGVRVGGRGNLTDIDIWKLNAQYHCWGRPEREHGRVVISLEDLRKHRENTRVRQGFNEVEGRRDHLLDEHHLGVLGASRKYRLHAPFFPRRYRTGKPGFF